jgi:hypothetical protein
MLPNKAFIAVTAVLTTLAIRYAIQAVPAREPRASLAIASLAAATAGVLWNALVVLTLGAPSEGLFSLGAIHSGVPLLSGSLYHSLLMLAWTLGYVLLTQPGRSVVPGSPSPVETPATTGRGRNTVTRLRLRDGAKTILLDPVEITWIEADGDYIRVHGAANRLFLRYTMSAVLRELPDGFVRVHRSSIVNIDRVRQLRPQPNREFEILLDDGTRAKASRTYAGALEALFTSASAREESRSEPGYRRR